MEGFEWPKQELVLMPLEVSKSFRFAQHHYYVYILTNFQQTVLYTGVTNNLAQRLYEHWLNRGNRKTFTGRYHCNNLVYYEYTPYILNALAREKEIKGWRRAKKLELIKTLNPQMCFLNSKVCKIWPPKNAKSRGDK